jgi:hypothetical protein
MPKHVGFQTIFYICDTFNFKGKFVMFACCVLKCETVIRPILGFGGRNRSAIVVI